MVSGNNDIDCPGKVAGIPAVRIILAQQKQEGREAFVNQAPQVGICYRHALVQLSKENLQVTILLFPPARWDTHISMAARISSPVFMVAFTTKPSGRWFSRAASSRSSGRSWRIPCLHRHIRWWRTGRPLPGFPVREHRTVPEFHPGGRGGFPAGNRERRMGRIGSTVEADCPDGAPLQQDRFAAEEDRKRGKSGPGGREEQDRDTGEPGVRNPEEWSGRRGYQNRRNGREQPADWRPFDRKRGNEAGWRREEGARKQAKLSMSPTPELWRARTDRRESGLYDHQGGSRRPVPACFSGKS